MSTHLQQLALGLLKVAAEAGRAKSAAPSAQRVWEAMESASPERIARFASNVGRIEERAVAKHVAAARHARLENKGVPGHVVYSRPDLVQSRNRADRMSAIRDQAEARVRNLSKEGSIELSEAAEKIEERDNDGLLRELFEEMPAAKSDAKKTLGQYFDQINYDKYLTRRQTLREKTAGLLPK